MDMNDFIRGSRRGHRPSEPRPDPEKDARVVAYLEAAGEPVPDYLRPKPTPDFGGGPRGRAIPAADDSTEAMNQFIRGRREIYP